MEKYRASFCWLFRDHFLSKFLQLFTYFTKCGLIRVPRNQVVFEKSSLGFPSASIGLIVICPDFLLRLVNLIQDRSPRKSYLSCGLLSLIR